MPCGCYVDSMQLTVPHCNLFCVCLSVQKWARNLAGQVDHIDVSWSLALLSAINNLSEASLFVMIQFALVLPRCQALLWLSFVWLSKTRIVRYQTVNGNMHLETCLNCTMVVLRL